MEETKRCVGAVVAGRGGVSRMIKSRPTAQSCWLKDGVDLQAVAPRRAPRLESSPELYASYVTRARMAAYVVCVSLTAPGLARPRPGPPQHTGIMALRCGGNSHKHPIQGKKVLA